MLTDHEKEKIRLEESYRFEIKSQLEKNQPKLSSLQKIKGFINSPFGLWILGAIFITGGATYYSSVAAKRDDERKTREAIERIEYEIKFRLTKVLVNLYESSKKVDSNYVKKVTYSLNTPGDSISYLYPDYKGWDYLSLLAEEKRLLNHSGKLNDSLNNVIYHVSGLPVFLEVNHLSFKDPRGIAIAIEDRLYLKRWKLEGWYFSDGWEKNPFL